ncbi:hypothetical protein [Undibacterium fentianense]|uniref:Uncharacterized protein n=1 Tax=Undibacterium fentianense TaxID=2828728 RepID=A0A941DZB2_9BURK|nr:hypothetical protein [Undibacterium fentianense]MBR7800259.1 hypothetical protein [Undibacterium fentianense]
MLLKIPSAIYGNKVIEYAELPMKILPLGYVFPKNGQAPLQSTDLVVIAVSVDAHDDSVYWVSCLNDQQEVITGEMYYTVESARNFLEAEYGVKDVKWIKVL